MSIEKLKAALPEYAKDIKLNLSSITRSSVLDQEQLWGTLLASAAATRNPQVLADIGAEATDHLSAAARHAALGAAAIMGMNNVFYRGRGFLEGRYDDLRPGLRMNIIANPGIPKANFELWSFAVSAINGCSHCLVDVASHRTGGGRDELDLVVGVDDKGHAVGHTVGVEDTCGLAEFALDVGEHREG